MFVTPPLLREKFNIPASAFQKQMETAISTASLVMRGAVVSAEIFTEADGEALEDDNEYYTRQLSVVESHSYLSYYFLLKDAGMKLTESGVLKSFQAGSSPATSSVMMNTVLTPSELALMKKDALASAKLFLGEYGTITIDEDGEAMAIIRESTLKWF
jgi:hypothetical protein